MKWIPEPDEFFVGYLAEIPKETSSFLKRIVVGIGISVVIVGSLLVYHQREFSTANFEYGTYTEIVGTLHEGPVPHIKLLRNKDENLKSYQTILLVGFGKMGAEKTINKYKEKVGELDGKYVRISGQLIHGHGKALLQIEEQMPPEFLDNPIALTTSTMTPLGEITVLGEIVDPKCYFGVMKPGEGKPHMSCAIRCIAGGIPPVFYSPQLEDYYLLLDENLEPVNQSILSLVGYEVTLSGNAIQFDDWKILQVNKEHLKKRSLQSAFIQKMIAMDKGMTMCNMN